MALTLSMVSSVAGENRSASAMNGELRPSEMERRSQRRLMVKELRVAQQNVSTRILREDRILAQERRTQEHLRVK
jgi:hypothetical protein